MSDGGVGALSVLALTAAIAGFGYLAILAGHVMRAEGLRQVRELLDRLEDARRKRERRALAEFGAASPAAQQISAMDAQAVARAVKQTIK